MKPLRKKFGEIVADIRESVGSTKKTAERFGVSVSTINRWIKREEAPNRKVERVTKRKEYYYRVERPRRRAARKAEGKPAIGRAPDGSVTVKWSELSIPIFLADIEFHLASPEGSAVKDAINRGLTIEVDVLFKKLGVLVDRAVEVIEGQKGGNAVQKFASFIWALFRRFYDLQTQDDITVTLQ